MKSQSSELRKGRSAKEILGGGILTFVLMTVIGMASNVVLLGVSYLVTPIFGTGEKTETEQQLIWLFFAAVAILVCAVAGFYFARFIGFPAADYRVSNEQERKLDILTMCLTLLLGAGLHGALCILVALNVIQNLFFAGPVLYLVRFLSKAPNSLFSEESLEISTDAQRIAAVLIYLIFFLVPIAAGYIHGFKQRIREIEAREEAARFDAKNQQIWSREDEDAVHIAEKNASEIQVKEKREVLAKETEDFFRALDKQEKIKTVLCILLWFAADFLLWYLYCAKTGRAFLSPSAVVFTALLIMPFYPLRMHEKLMRRTYYAEVTLVDVDTQVVAQAIGKGASRRSEKQIPRILLKSKMGESEEIRYKSGTHLPYAKGDRVFKLGAFQYPVPCDFDELDTVFCPKCGFRNERGWERCRQCRTKLGRKK